jgi:hypothetical protein
MRWRIFTFLAGLSFLLLLASIVLWVRSYWYEDQIPLSSIFPNDPRYLASHRGAWYIGSLVNFPTATGFAPTVISVRSHYYSEFLFRFLLVPVWWSVIWAIRREIRQRGDIPHCSVCDYDLRAHRPGDRCPECGALIPHTEIENSNAGV